MRKGFTPKDLLLGDGHNHECIELCGIGLGLTCLYIATRVPMPAVPVNATPEAIMLAALPAASRVSVQIKSHVGSSQACQTATDGCAASLHV